MRNCCRIYIKIRKVIVEIFKNLILEDRPELLIKIQNKNFKTTP